MAMMGHSNRAEAPKHHRALIEGFSLKLGPAPGETPIAIDKPAVTVFVGPNNSGKSQVLREIFSVCVAGSYSGAKILDKIRFSAFTPEEAQQALEAFSSVPRPGETSGPHVAYLEHGAWRSQVHVPHYIAALTEPNATDHRAHHFAQYYAHLFTVNLDGANRMALVTPKDRGDLKRPDNSFSRLLTNNPRRSALRGTIFDALGLYLGIDMSHGNQLQLRFGATPPPNERTVEDDVLQWMRDALPADQVSDGVKAFSGILIELQAGDPRIILIDEPEAFLHPSLAFTLGKEIARTATEGRKQVFVATHSPQFLVGAIQSGASVNVVRLTYRGGVGTARLLPNSDVTAIMRDPLLRSANTLAGLFYENVVVTEADADRAFYQEINDRLIEFGPGRGMPNTLFLNGNGKDTVHRIVSPLRRLGIPAAAVLDIDVLKSGGANWLAHLAACGIPVAQRSTFQNQRDVIWKLLAATERDPKREGGIDLLQGDDREAATNLIDSLAAYGLFVLKGGEVENWLPQLSISRAKHNWLHGIFEALGSVPGSTGYVMPSSGDVWDFVDTIAAWAASPAHRGVR